MILKIKNFGPIKEAEIDLTKRVYIFVGYNNSGKSLVSQLLYTIFDKKNINSFFEFFMKKKFDIHEEEDSFLLSQEGFEIAAETYSKYLKSDIIPKTFNVSESHFLIKDAEFEVILPSIDFYKKLEFEVIGSSTIGDGLVIMRLKKLKNELKVIRSFSDFELDLESQFDLANLKFDIDVRKSYSFRNKSDYHKFIVALIFSQNSTNIFLPASRIFYSTFYQYIYKIEKERRENAKKEFDDLLKKLLEHVKTNKLISQAERTKKNLKSLYTEPTSKLIAKIYETEKSHSHDYYSQELETLESIIGGKINIRNLEGFGLNDFTLLMEDGKELDMYLASSSANQLTTLYLYFKYWAEKDNNFLFIDEPEENLHPANQKKLLELLLGFALKANNRVLLVNHTPFFADMINNYIMLGTLKDLVDDDTYQAQIERLDTPSLPLTKENTGIYFFNGETVFDYEIGEYGTIFADFGIVKNQTKFVKEELSELIYNNLKVRRNA